MVKFTIEDNCCVDDNFIGTTVSKKINIDILNPDNSINLENKEIEVYTGVNHYDEERTIEGTRIEVKDIKEISARLNIEGNTEQATRSGKNLVNVFETITTNSGFTLPDISISEDGFVTYENTGGYRNALFNTFEAEPSTTYYSYLEVIEETRIPVVYLREFNENMEQLRVSYPKNQNFVTMSTTKYIQYGLTTDAYTSTGKFTARPMIVKTSSVDNIYEPYGAMPSPEFPSDIKNLGDNINLFDKDNANILIGFFNINHTSIQTSTVSYCAYIPIEGGLTYTVSKLEGVRLNVGTTSVIPKVGTELIDNAGNQDKLGNAENGEECTIKTSLNANYLVVQYCSTNADTESEENLRNSIKIEEGSKATSPSEYGCGSVGIKIENKNKINLGELTTSSNAGLTSKTEKSVWKITGTSNTNGYANSTGRISIGKIKAGTYTFSWNYIGKLPYNETNYATISIYNVKTGNVIVSKRVDIDDKSEQFTLTEDTELKLGIWNVGSGNVYDVEFYLQLEEGEKTDYEEHQEQTVVFPLSKGQLLHKGDYLAKDGVHQIKAIYILNGTEEWQEWAVQTGTNTKAYVFRNFPKASSFVSQYSGCRYLSTHFLFDETNNYNDDKELLFLNEYNAIGIRINIEKGTDLTTFKTYLAEQYANGTPVTVEYELAEEVVIPYTEEQQKVYNQLQHLLLYKDYTDIDCINEVKPNLKLTYGKEIIPLGRYIIEKLENEEVKQKTSFIGYDDMIKFNMKYIDNIEYPITLKEYLKNLCKQVGIELGNENLVNEDYLILGNPFTNNESCKVVLSNIAQLCGGFAKIGRDNKLYIVSLEKEQNKENIKEFIDGNNYDETFEKNNIWGEVNSLIIRLSDIEGENTVIQDDESIIANGLTEMTIANNSFLIDSTQRDLVKNELWNSINGLKYLPFSTNYYGYPYLDAGDLIEIKDNKDNSFYSYVLNHTITYNGVYNGSIETTALTKTQTAYKNTENIKTKFKKVEYVVDKINGQITQLIEEQNDTTEKITKQEQDIDSITDTISKIESDNETTKESIAKITETVENWSAEFSVKGGNNVFYYAKEFWNDGTENGTANLVEYTDTEIQQKSVSGNGYIINKGTSEQKQKVKNDTYTISFTYKKLVELATVYVEINGTRIDLTSTDWKEEVVVINIGTNTVEFKIVSDTASAVKIFDLMGTIGNEKQVWTQNPNETRTDTVTIGKGIQVNSSSKNTYARFDADGNRIFNSVTGDVVTELTDQGVDTDKVSANVGQVGGVLIQIIDGQTWFSSLL